MKTHCAKFGERLDASLVPPQAILNELGYQHLRMKELDAALAAFRYNAELYAQSANVWDSLCDAHDAAGKKDEALTSHRKAVSLAETNGAPNLETLRSK